jgi:hypothetical protein
MVKSILIRFTFTIAIFLSITKLTAADTTQIAWSATPGAWESFIMGDTTSTGEQNADVYVLESSKVHLQVNILRLYSSCEIRGADYDESAGGFPATIQQIPGSDGTSQFDNWPASNILTYGAHQSYKLHNLLFNGALADQSGTTFGVMATYGQYNTIVVDHVTSVHNQVITYFNFGKKESWTLTNNTAIQYTCYPAGMYFGGFFWGGGSWVGTLRNLYVQNNTIEGAHANPLVIYSSGGGIGVPGAATVHVDHNTFVNTIDLPKFYRDGNNSHHTNNLYVNSISQGQTKNNKNTSLSQNKPGGLGKMATLAQGTCADSTLLANGDCWDNMARNIDYSNNAWYDTPELIALMEWGADGWCWNLQGADGTDSLDADGNVVSLCDTMLAVADQSKWLDDSTNIQIASHGVSESNNIHATDLGWNLDPMYINRQIERNKDWLDNGVHNTFTDYWWNVQEDDNPVVVQWPIPMDFSYSATSSAATACSHGGPVGSTKHMDHSAALEIDVSSETLPNRFGLKQNYPNPFNPTTEIAFTLDQTADVNLSIYNMLGQKVRTLTNGSKNAGTHTLQWNGLDEMGQNVSTGIYLYRLTSGSKSITKKMAFMK